MGPIPDPRRANHKILTVFWSHHKILLTNFPVADKEAPHRCVRRGQALTQQTRLHSGAAGFCFGESCDCRRRNVRAPDKFRFGFSKAQTRSPNAKKAPGASTRTSQHGSEEPPDTFSAGVPRRASHMVPARRPGPRARPCGLPPPDCVPEGPLSGCRLARRLPGSRPRRPKPPGRSAFDPVPRARLSGSSADRPKAFAASATGFLAVPHRVNGYCVAPAGEATKNCAGSSKFRWITKQLAEKCLDFFPQSGNGPADFRRFRLWIKLSPRNFHRGAESGAARARQPAGLTGAPVTCLPFRFIRSGSRGRARRADGGGCAPRARWRTAPSPHPVRRCPRSGTGWHCPRP